ncbi:uncharacterized protein Dyak_GE28018 [Drosophila yakuba]|uniref:Uncharacterized protein n=1 Tax=Drosophila yakuba TaxID=7245 RepID=A0A0R1ED84_DROYA|nr:uncharacterized protein Dyak_GE28018 [Drosophila yakuba]
MQPYPRMDGTSHPIQHQDKAGVNGDMQRASRNTVSSTRTSREFWRREGLMDRTWRARGRRHGLEQDGKSTVVVDVSGFRVSKLSFFSVYCPQLLSLIGNCRPSSCNRHLHLCGVLTPHTRCPTKVETD